jgi:hypothetical protein
MKRTAPKPEPVKIAARDAAGPPLRQAIVEGRAHQVPASPMAQIQLGAFRGHTAATEGWNKIVAASEGALQGKLPLVVPVDLQGKGRLWRLRAVVEDKSSARRLCAALGAKGLACMVVRD